MVGLIVSSVIMLVGSVFMVVGLITTEWVKGNNKNVNFNLFEYCEDDDCIDEDWDNKIPETDSSAIDSVRFLSVFGASFGFLALLMSLVFNAQFYTGVDEDRKQLLKQMNIFIICLCGVSVILIATSCAVFKKEVFDKEDPDDIIDYELGYSYYLTLIGGLLNLPSGIIIAICGARNS